MRITIHIDDNQHAKLKNIAARTGRTLTAVIHVALFDALARRRNRERSAIDLPVFNGTGVMPGVDLNDSAALLDHIENDQGRPPVV